MMLELPTDAEVKQAMDEVLAQAAQSGRVATVTAVERKLGMRHATFYRHFQPMIAEYFRPRAQPDSTPAMLATTDEPNASQTMARLRQENTELRKLVNIYAETIRQPTIDNTNLEAKIQTLNGITRLKPRR
ncbi:hypothetical protein ACIQWA_34810 [Kitasatospora sp. NPDC098652]|uniref:hypothetical protein n=1 Tax=Kitasatospora sp. NPDC098652 TaxID=3364095 RepID=UPI0037F1C485